MSSQKKNPGGASARAHIKKPSKDGHPSITKPRAKSKSPGKLDIGHVLEAALRYAAELGWRIFPAHPIVKKSLKSAKYSNGASWGMTNDPVRIRKDFAKFKPRRIGIPTGIVNGFFVVEADTVEGHGVDGIASMSTLESKHGKLPETLMAESPSGSIHRYFKHPGGRVKCTSSKIAPGVDVKGDGGMVIAPPSVNADGRTYAWLNWGTPIAAAPAWLVALVCAGERPPDADANHFETYGGASAKDNAGVDVEELSAALDAIPNDVDRDRWISFAFAIKHATGGSDEGFALFVAFSRRWTEGTYDEEDTAKAWRGAKPRGEVTAGTIFRMADEADPNWRIDLYLKKNPDGGVSISDFHAYMEMHNYIFAPTRGMWPASSVNARIPPIRIGVDKAGKPKTIPASAWLDKHSPVEQITWAPGEPKIIRDRLISEGGWIERTGVSCFNLYRPPTIVPGDAAEAGPWLDHVRKVYPDDADHIIRWLAHRVQRPQEKINHALVFGGSQGIGKDTIIEPVKRAVGPWNVAEINPKQGMGRFNGFVKSVILRINEARDLGDADRYQLYEHMKPITATPPDVLRVDEKNLREYTVLNCTGVIITTNNQDSLYLPADDRRYYVAWSPLTKEDFPAAYWVELWIESSFRA
jgi:Bifunctional DNA primase/polymerase, N-terminal/Primase C terminal 2 (PriCT-2)/Family of unknown function (DUF5906)